MFGLTKGMGRLTTSVATNAHDAEPRTADMYRSGDLHSGDIAAQGWELLREDVSLPVAVLRESRIEHNLRWMQTFIDRYGVKPVSYTHLTLPTIYSV